MPTNSYSDIKSTQPGAIGIFDSGYGGLTILNEIRKQLPQYDYLYLGDNARSPYGTRSFDVVYKFTLQCVQYLFKQGCQLVILACNTASATDTAIFAKWPNRRRANAGTWGNSTAVLPEG